MSGEFPDQKQSIQPSKNIDPTRIGLMLLIIAIVGGIIFLFIPSNKESKQASIAPTTESPTSPTPTIALTTEYENPFEEESQYENPFAKSAYVNPFNAIDEL